MIKGEDLKVLNEKMKTIELDENVTCKVVR